MDLDVLGQRSLLVQAGLPGANTVGATEDGGGRNGRSLDQSAQPILIFDLAAAYQFVGSPGIGRFGRPRERTAQTDQAAYLVGCDLGEPTGIEAAQAPADEAQSASVVALEQLLDTRQHVALEVGAQTEVAPLLPAMRVVAARIEEVPERAGTVVVRQ